MAEAIGLPGLADPKLDTQEAVASAAEQRSADLVMLAATEEQLRKEAGVLEAKASGDEATAAFSDTRSVPLLSWLVSYKEPVSVQILVEDWRVLAGLLRGQVAQLPWPTELQQRKLDADGIALTTYPGAAPMEALGLATARRLIVFPDGVLSFLPFEVFRDAAGAYLIERCHVEYRQSLTVS